MSLFNLHSDTLTSHIKSWLQEDIGTGDVSALVTIPETHQSKGIIHAKQDGVIAGLPLIAMIFNIIDPQMQIQLLIPEGEHVSKGTTIAEINGNTRNILSGERLVLNLLQRLSGIASKTKQFATIIEDLDSNIADTRKTTPGLRVLEKYAVRIGGGVNHRVGLYDAVMIKDNHIKAAGGITAAVSNARKSIPHTMKIEVEVESLQEVTEALSAGADIIMLDNMHAEHMVQAVHQIREVNHNITIEASGGINLQSIRSVAETGVDIISIGGLTNGVQTIDISLDLYQKKGEEV
ncbi:carboxylating nicotinate-nucleotide diphosphorylase [Longirhabdus pacifica]|uniref:carboxylating nicotinate-nucleotide diphosphorylase n=1 Tax=Longirhabdus pacifica TaxID=2305227 RepID=UPI0010092A4F|nr:carboxylating nicotinate-nucleotide diphosphorylase [Longirhabdus pacifica]